MKINNIKSKMLSITKGVPQCLIIGLLLYINDFAQANKMLSFLINADDTTISSTLNMFSYNIHDQNLDYLTNEELLDKWLLKINKVSLNVAKSKYMKCHHILTLHSMTICNTANNKNMCCAKASS